MDRRVTPPKRVTSPTRGPPPPCKHALSVIYDGCVNTGHTGISFIFTFKLLVNLSDSHFLICIRFNDSVSKGHTPLTFIQTCTFLLVTLIHFSKQGFVNSLTILLLYVYVHNLH